MDNKYVVFFDFDNTITKFDVIDNMLERFSKDNGWMELEKHWRSGKIGSKDCLRGQVKGIRISKKDLNSYLKSVKLDPYFKKVLTLLRSKNIQTYILTDNFDYMVKTILKSNKLNKIPVYSNKVRLTGDKLMPSFPRSSKTCGNFCGHCKKTTMRRLSEKNKTLVYVGDGRSDICPAKSADVVFAKDTLLKYCRSNKIDHIPLNNINDVYSYFQEKE
jgi:2-hydroxy-3-keto-5-methylthiopentenyl-1-phosphate phosphatase